MKTYKTHTNHERILYFVWSPPWHFKMYIWTYILASYLTYVLAFYLAVYLTYILTFYLAFYLAFYLTYILAFYLTYILAFYLTFYLAFYLAYILAFYLTYILTFYLAFYLAYILAFYRAVAVQQCPLGSEAPVPTGLGRSPVEVQRSGLERSLVEVQQCPLISGAGSWGPAMPTAIRSWRGGEEEKEKAAEEGAESYLKI